MADAIYVLGTETDCDIRITDDPYVSKHHARVIVYSDGRATVEDLGTTNGTYVSAGGGRGRVYGPTPLFAGNVIWLGIRTPVTWNPPEPERPAQAEELIGKRTAWAVTSGKYWEEYQICAVFELEADAHAAMEAVRGDNVIEMDYYPAGAEVDRD